jgi:CubicO group peptidase (beta-lactamase class C family)
MLRRAALLLGVLAAPALAQSAPNDSVARWVDSLLSPYASKRTPGCAVGIRRNGSLVLAKGYGMADLEHDVPITPETPFYVASIAKQFTAMAVVLLARDHRLSLDDSIRRWVPEVPSFGAPITLRQLLNHTSGLRDYLTLLAMSGWPSDGPLTEQQFLTLIGRQRSLNFTPGDEFLYSNTGYALLAIVVKRASGQSLRDFAAERIFKPLGMTNTEFRDDHTALIRQRAIGYSANAQGYHASQPQFDVVGDGGAYSTIDDLAKWDANFDTGRVGGKDGIALLETPGRLNDGQEIRYGLGVALGEFRGRKTVSHGGAYGGYRGAVMRVPSEHLTVLSLCNTAQAPAALNEQIGRLMLGVGDEATRVASAPPSGQANLMAFGAAQAPGDSTGARQRNDQLAELAGGYYSAELELSVDVAPKDGVLVLSRPRADDLRFVPLADDLLMNRDQILMRVLRDDGGRVTGFALTVNRVRDLTFTRRAASP